MVDGPQGFKSSVPPIVATTSPELAVVRFHGRRTATWESMQGRATVDAFGTCTSRTSCASGCRGSWRRPARRATRTCS